MADANTVVIVSNKQDFLNQISSKLVLLRNLDKVKTSSVEEAQNMFCGFVPNVLILHCKDNDAKIINLIKEIKKQDIYKHLSILLINENCSRETIIEAFDAGINDVLFAPVIDYELLIRVIWCLKRNEINLSMESQSNFLVNLEIMSSQGVYSQKYCDEFLKNEIAQTKKYSQRACLLLISPDKKYRADNNLNDFVSVIKKSIRLNDSVAIKDSDKFYIYLQKTKLNGAYSVFERINNCLGNDKGASAGVVEIQEQKYEDIIEALDSALDKANENTNSLIVASDFYANEKQPIINIDNVSNTQTQDSMTINDEESKNNVQTAFDKNSIKLFNQAYERKIKVVLEPVFKKYENLIRTKKSQYAVNSYTGAKSLFSVSSGDVSASFALDYNGVENVTIRLTISENDQKRLFETDTIEFTVLDYRKVSLMLSELIDKFTIILKRRKDN